MTTAMDIHQPSDLFTKLSKKEHGNQAVAQVAQAQDDVAHCLLLYVLQVNCRIKLCDVTDVD